jgi:hypothetical protein
MDVAMDKLSTPGVVQGRNDGAPARIKALVDHVTERFWLGLKVPIDVRLSILHIDVGDGGRLSTDCPHEVVHDVADMDVGAIFCNLPDPVDQLLCAGSRVVGVEPAKGRVWKFSHQFVLA